MKVLGASVVLGVLCLSVSFSSATELYVLNSGPRAQGSVHGKYRDHFIIQSERPEALLTRIASTPTDLIRNQEPAILVRAFSAESSRFQFAAIDQNKSFSEPLVKSTFGMYALAGSIPEPVLLLIFGAGLLGIAGLMHRNRIQKRKAFTERTERSEIGSRI